MNTGPARGWRRTIWRVFAGVFVLVLIGALGMALAGQDWSVVTVVLEQRDSGQIAVLLAGAVLVSVAGLFFGLLSWRVVLLELGPPVSAARVVRIFFVGFLAKYVPGKVPGLIALTKVASSSGVTFGRLMSAGALTMSLVVLTGLTIGLLAGVQVLGAQVVWLVLAAVLIAVVLVRPQLINRGAHLLLRLLRKSEPARSASSRGVRLAVAAQSVSWLISGLHLWLLAIAVGAPPARSLALCVGAFSLATTVGLLAVVLPDGIGVREAVLAAALTVVLPVPAAAVVALASRLVSTVSEIAVGGVALTVAEVVHRRTQTAESSTVTGGKQLCPDSSVSTIASS